MTIFNQITIRIIKEQEVIIGPIAWQEAKKVKGLLVVDQKKNIISIEGDAKNVLNKLVAQYTRLFGRISTDVCKEAVQDLLVELPKDQIPSSLR